MTWQYSSLLCSGDPQVAETPASYNVFSERHLQALWLEQKHFHKLSTDIGEPIEVLSPGIWNTEAGPDFVRAHFKVGKREYRGDVELHLRASSWISHHHHSNPAYNQVVLHISLFPHEIKREFLREDGSNIPLKIVLEPLLKTSVNELSRNVDLELYPYRRCLGSGHCAQELFTHMDEEKLKTFFFEAACWRFSQKHEFMMRACSPPWNFIGGIASALGYKKNANTFLELFKELIPMKDEYSVDTLLAYCMKRCGLFSNSWEEHPYYRELVQAGDIFNIHTPTLPLDLSQIRPANHPLRRLVYLINLIKDPRSLLLQKMLEELCETHRMLPPKKMWDLWSATLPTYSHSHWNTHTLFKPSVQQLPLIGKQCRDTLLANAWLPFLVASNRKHLVEALITEIPGLQTQKKAYLDYRFLGDRSWAFDPKSIGWEQGMYQVHRDFCVHYEASCQGCPFVKRFQSKVL